MISRLISLISFLASAYFIMRYRYRIMNVVLGQPMLRRLAVKMSMQVPFVRQKIMSQIFYSPQPKA